MSHFSFLQIFLVVAGALVSAGLGIFYSMNFDGGSLRPVIAMLGILIVPALADHPISDYGVLCIWTAIYSSLFFDLNRGLRELLGEKWRRRLFGLRLAAVIIGIPLATACFKGLTSVFTGIPIVWQLNIPQAQEHSYEYLILAFIIAEVVAFSTSFPESKGLDEPCDRCQG
jgi:hypothetical protein